MTEDAARARRMAQLQDEMARETAARTEAQTPLPEFRQALYTLIRQYGHEPGLWRWLAQIANEGPDFYAWWCRICGRPQHRRWYRCSSCGADKGEPTVIEGSVIKGELEEPPQ